ncbi:ABC transporter permease [Bacteriovoracaceae bacterium]|nr:ABC transporter permease [Bacteriovoracaceae bacterium]
MIFVLIKKELRSYFNSSFAYILSALFIFLMGWMFVNTLNLSKNTESISLNAAIIRPIFGNMTFLFLFIAPLITMKTFSEEKRDKTIDLLLCSLLKDYQIVLGKFIAVVMLISFMVSLTTIFPIILWVCGYSDWWPILTSYLGLMLCLSTYAAIGLFVSTLTENQIIAAVCTFAILVFFMLISQSVIFLENFYIARLIQYFGIGSHFAAFTLGIISSVDIIYYLSFIGFFMYLSCLSMEARNW